MSRPENSGFDYRRWLPAAFQQGPLGPADGSNRAAYSLLQDGDNNHASQNVDSSSSSSDSEESSSSWCCDELSFRERLLGFGTCLVAGYMLSFGSFFRIGALVMGNPRPLVWHAAMGNLLAWAGSFFLVGPRTQWKRLWDAKRKLATQVYLLTLILLVAIVYLHPWGPEGLYLLVILLAQNIAMTWYCLSYIPYAQETVAGYVRERQTTTGWVALGP